MAVTSSQLLDRVKRGISEVSPESVKRGLQSGEVRYLIDVRERDEVLDGYIPGAELIPRGFLELNIEEDVTMDRNAGIVLYCAGGNRSALAARDLEEMGYSNVSSMIGGIKSWKEAGFGIEQNGLLSAEDLQRYSRHILLPEVGEQGQQELLRAKVLLIGAGGLGCPTGLYLAAAGIGNIGLVDADIVDKSNLQRQVLFGESMVGEPKVEAGETTPPRSQPWSRGSRPLRAADFGQRHGDPPGVRHYRQRMRQFSHPLPGERCGRSCRQACG